jgi:CDP-glycerol glycerophosphotransferase
MIMEAFPNSLFVYNIDFGETNTSKSLLRALVATGPFPVLWLNGDVVFDSGLVDELGTAIEEGTSFVCVNTARVGEEEVKYNVDDDGWIKEISKEVEAPLGEAVGINFISSTDKPALIEFLGLCDDYDYFEKGIEKAIEACAMKAKPVDISNYSCIEVDFIADLDKALKVFT